MYESSWPWGHLQGIYETWSCCTKISAVTPHSFNESCQYCWSKNTNLKGLTTFIMWSASKNASPQGKRVSWRPRAITSSENAGDVIVENTSVIMVWRRSPRRDSCIQAPTCRDRRALSRDKLNSETGKGPAHHQPEHVDKPTQNHSLSEATGTLNRRISRVSAHASNRTGAQLAPLRTSM